MCIRDRHSKCPSNFSFPQFIQATLCVCVCARARMHSMGAYISKVCTIYRSDASSDSENYVVVNMAEREGETADAIFCVGGTSSTGRGTITGNTSGVEVASEVLEEEATITTPSESHSIASSCKRRDLVSI